MGFWGKVWEVKKMGLGQKTGKRFVFFGLKGNLTYWEEMLENLKLRKKTGKKRGNFFVWGPQGKRGMGFKPDPRQTAVVTLKMNKVGPPPPKANPFHTPGAKGATEKKNRRQEKKGQC